MNNKLIIAAAGSGKTTYLIQEALKIQQGKILITTYTEANEKEIRKKIIRQNKGIIPNNIIIQTWYSFLLQHGVKPYQSVIFSQPIKGLTLVNGLSTVKGTNTFSYYCNNSQLIYSDKVSEFIVTANNLSGGNIIDRISRIFNYIFIDEIQDMVGYDLEIFKLLFNTKSTIILVGDPRQATYRTHNPRKYIKYSNGNIEKFITDNATNVIIDNSSLNTNYRSHKDICDYANLIYNNYPKCVHCNNFQTGHDGIFIIKKASVENYIRKFHPTILRYSSKQKVNNNYEIMTFGQSKGLTFERVLIYPTKNMIQWIFDHKTELKPQTKSKFYVAITRAKYSIAIVCDDHIIKKGQPLQGIYYYSC